MAVYTVFVLCVFCFQYVLGNSQLPLQDDYHGAKPTRGEPWPLPQIYTPSAETFSLNYLSFEFQVTGSTCDTLAAAIRRYEEIIFGDHAKIDSRLKFFPKFQRFSSADGNVNKLSVHVQETCDTAGNNYPSLESNEAYNLTVESPNSELIANSVWGALRGLETFSQLIYEGLEGQLEVNKTTIQDFPRFKYRGLLLDSARHFLSVEILKKNLDAMAYNKFNVFHWHIVDDQSFPYESVLFPQMSAMGSYFGLSHTYTQADIKDVVEHARLRGIRVIPEFDTPGHTQSWGKAIQNLLTKCYTSGKPNGNYGPIDPSLNSTYDFLKKFFGEVAEVFPDHYIHLGGDEVSFSCWQSNPQVTDFMKKMSFGTNYAQLEQYYMQNLLTIINSLNKGYLIWQEVIDNGATVRPDTIVEVWKGGYQAELAKVTKMGYHALLSSCWYLNLIAYGSDWKRYYACDPWDMVNGTQKQLDLVIGGEACMWGEYVDNTNVISRTWPRAAAVGERLWSNMKVRDGAKAAPRMAEHRCRLIRRGIQAEPVNGPDFCEHEYRGV
ncbi:beta-hexosaminidase subunit alpha-like isoform X1 [Pecten maximus]|uniref:beta-hexosaminidase subunit alpha-like isoform X1 n=1 Tax=Pecten maximus TaxID=6579 RepID=UPI0014582050|nr:beta-hexosaminidase subunit alpha-like isoform X1 [Pecten maximus]